MAKKDLRTEQEVSPHADLVAVRNAVQEHCKDENGGKVSRRQAAAMCNLLTDAECSAIIASVNDSEKIQKIATRVQRAEDARAAKEAAKAKKREANDPRK